MTNPQAWEATSDDEGGKDDDVNLPPAHAPIIQGLVLHKAQARRSTNEEVIDFSASGGSVLLQDMRFQNPTSVFVMSGLMVIASGLFFMSISIIQLSFQRSTSPSSISVLSTSVDAKLLGILR
jgi:hypothetical protein